MGIDPIEPECLEAEPDDCRGGLARVSLAPPVAPDPEPQLGLKVFVVDVPKAGRAYQRRSDNQADGEVSGPSSHRLPALIADPGQGVVQAVGVGNRHRGIRDLTSPGHPLQLRGIARLEWPEEEARRADGRRGTHGALIGVSLRLFDLLRQLGRGLPQARELSMSSADGTPL